MTSWLVTGMPSSGASLPPSVCPQARPQESAKKTASPVRIATVLFIPCSLSDLRGEIIISSSPHLPEGHLIGDLGALFVRRIYNGKPGGAGRVDNKTFIAPNMFLERR